MNRHNTYIQHCTAVILTGGQSKRMGQDKASMVFEGQTLLARAEQSLTPLFEHVVVSTRQKRDDTELPQVLDDSEYRAPMMGIVAAFEAVDTDWLFVVGVDMPFIAADLLKHMAKYRAGHDAVLVKVEERLQPLLAFYRKESCLPLMRARIHQGNRSLINLIPHIHTNVLKEDDIQQVDYKLKSFIDFDMPSDLESKT